MVCCQRYNQMLSWCLQENLFFLTLLDQTEMLHCSVHFVFQQQQTQPMGDIF